MKKVYFEQRVSAARGTASQAADLMRHLHTRQYLGRAVIICDQPIAMLSAVRKQWLKLSRNVQYRRSETLNVDKILKYTHTITRMQRMNFTSKNALDWPNADVYCLRPEDAEALPDDCFSVYVTIPLASETAEIIACQLPEGSLVVDYGDADNWQKLHLLPKSAIEQSVISHWHTVEEFLRKQHINPSSLFNGNLHNVQEMDDALDTLLGASKTFMPLADEFHHTLALARPLRINKPERMKYDALSLLAHRVQALSPGEYTQRFLESYNEDDGMFLYDSDRNNHYSLSQLEYLAQYHKLAGRQHIAQAYFALHGKLLNLEAMFD